MSGGASASAAGGAGVVDGVAGDRLKREIDELKAKISANHDPSKPKQKPQESSRQQAGTYRGIQKKSEHAWSASIFVTCLGNQQQMLGTFPTAELAAKMYDAAARVVFGEDASFNFPDAPNHDPPLAKDVAEKQLELRPGKTTQCKGCGQTCPVKNKACFVCKATLKADDMPKGVQKRHITGNPRAKYMAVFSCAGTTHTIGTYWTKEEAAYHYDAEARKVHGDDECDDPAKKRVNHPDGLEVAKQRMDDAIAALEEENGGPMPRIVEKTKKRQIVKGGVAWRAASDKPESGGSSKKRKKGGGGKKAGGKKRKKGKGGDKDGVMKRGVRRFKDGAKSGGLDLSVAFARKKMDVNAMLFGNLLDSDGTPA
jgi:hypothetical protein